MNDTTHDEVNRYDRLSPEARALVDDYDECDLAEMLVAKKNDIASCNAQQWPQRLARAEAAIARVRTLAEQWQASVRPGEPHPAAQAVLAALKEDGPAATEATEPATITNPEWLHHQYTAIISVLHDNRPDHIATELLRVHAQHLAQLRQRLTLADQAHRQEQQYADRLAGLARDILYADQITGDRIAHWREQLDQLTDQQPAHNGPTVRECAEADRRWPLEKHGE